MIDPIARCVVRALIAAGFVLGAATTAALASAGCDAYAGTINGQESSQSTTTISEFEAGDTLVLSHTGTENFWGIYTYPGYAFKFVNYVPNDYAESTYTFTESDISTYGSSYLMTRSLGGNGGDTLTFSCVSKTPGGGGGAADDSDSLAALRWGTTPLVARLSAQALEGAISTQIDAMFGGTAAAISSNGSGITLNFLAKPSAPAVDPGTTAAPAGHGADVPPVNDEWSLWADLRGTAFDSTGSSGNAVVGGQGNLVLGLGRQLSTDLLVGAVLGYEQFDYDVAGLDGNLNGSGTSLGAYGGLRLAPNLYFDGTLVWSQMSYNGSAGTASGAFSGSRWVASGGLNGSLEWAGLQIVPSARALVLTESQSGFTDSLGVEQSAGSYAWGRIATGGQVSYPFVLVDGTVLSPYLSGYADWQTGELDGSDGIAADLLVAGLSDGWSGRLGLGVSLVSQEALNLRLGGELAGLGTHAAIASLQMSAALRF